MRTTEPSHSGSKLDNVHGFLAECIEKSCPLRRTVGPGHRERFFKEIQDKFFQVLHLVSNKNDGRGINIAFLGSGSLLSEAQIVSLMIESGIKIKSVALIDLKYALLKKTLENGPKSLDIFSPSLLDPSPDKQFFHRAVFLVVLLMLLIFWRRLICR